MAAEHAAGMREDVAGGVNDLLDVVRIGTAMCPTNEPGPLHSLLSLS